MTQNTPRTPKQEAIKQVKDQFAHTAWGWGTGFLPFVGFFTLGFWGAIVAYVLANFSEAAWTHRERIQFFDGAHVWWDPWLDTGFYRLGVLLGAFTGIAIIIF